MSTIIDDNDIIQHAADEFTEAYERVDKDINRMRKLFDLMDVCSYSKPLERSWQLNTLINNLKTLERYFKKARERNPADEVEIID